MAWNACMLVPCTVRSTVQRRVMRGGVALEDLYELRQEGRGCLRRGPDRMGNCAIKVSPMWRNTKAAE